MSGEFLKIRTNQIIWRKPNPKKSGLKTKFKTYNVIYRFYKEKRAVQGKQTKSDEIIHEYIEELFSEV